MVNGRLVVRVGICGLVNEWNKKKIMKYMLFKILSKYS